jgi:hypothetical protein
MILFTATLADAFVIHIPDSRRWRGESGAGAPLGS